MSKTPLTDKQEIFSSTPSYTFSAQENYEPQQPASIATDDRCDDFDPVRSAEEIQPFIFTPYLFPHRHNPFLTLMLMTAVNGHLVLAADDNNSPRSDESLTPLTIADNNNVLSSAEDLPPSSMPIALYEATGSLTEEDSSHDSSHEEKQPLAGLPEAPLNPLTEIGEKFSKLLLDNKLKTAQKFLTTWQQKNPTLQLKDVRDKKGRPLLEIIIASNYSDKKINLVEYLIKAGCDVNAIGSDGRVLLSVAVAMHKSNKKLIELLLKINGTKNAPTEKISLAEIFIFCIVMAIHFDLYSRYKSHMHKRTIAMLEKQLKNLSHFEKLFLNSEESPSEAETPEKQIKKTKTTISKEIETLHSFKVHKQTLQKIAISYQQLATPVKNHIKAHCVEKIKKTLTLFKEKHPFLEQNNSKPAKTLLQNKQEDLEKNTHIQHQDNQEDLGNIITTGEQLLNKINSLIKNYISEEFQKLSAELESMVSRLNTYENLTKLKTDISTKITELSTFASFPINFNKLEKLIISCKDLQRDASKRIAKQDLAQLRARKNADELALQKKQEPLLTILRSIEILLNDLDHKQADLTCATIGEYRQNILSIDISDQPTWDKYKTASENLLQETKKLAQTQQKRPVETQASLQRKKAKEDIENIEKDIDSFVTQLTKDESDLLQATTDVPETKAVIAADELMADIDTQLTTLGNLRKKLPTLSLNATQEITTLQEKLPTTHINNLHKKSKKILSQLKKEAKEADQLESKETQTQTHPKEDKKSTAPQKNSTDSVTPSTSGMFSSVSRSTPSRITTQPISQPPPKRNSSGPCHCRK